MKKLSIFTICMCIVMVANANAEAQLKWGNAGLPIASAQDFQYLQKSVLSTTGDMFVSWTDNRAGDSETLNFQDDIYIQKLDTDGNKYWLSEGLPVVVKPGKQALSDMISDGAGGVFLAWVDYARGDNKIYVFIQRIDKDGLLAWGNEGILIDSSTGIPSPELCSDGSGGVFIIWGSGGIGISVESIKVQRVSGEGALLWPEEGIIISDPAKHIIIPSLMVSDDNGGVICLLNYDNNLQFAVQRLDQDGNKLWGEQGVVAVQLSHYTSAYDMVKDGQGGAIVCWSEGVAQRIDALGNLQWADGKQLLFLNPPGSSYSIQKVKVIDDGTGNLIFGKFCYSHYTETPSYIDVQKFSLAGDLLWNDGIRAALISMFGGSGFDMCDDGSGGLFVAWIDGTTFWQQRPYAQYFNALGDKLWGEGIALIDLLYVSYDNLPNISKDDAGGALVFWQDARNGSYYNGDIYGQRIHPDSTPPSTPIITDEGAYTDNNEQLYASWVSDDGESGLRQYEYSITEGAINGTLVRDWTTTGIFNSVTAGGLNLTDGNTYYFAVKAQNGAGMWSNIGYSDGITVDALNQPPAKPSNPTPANGAYNQPLSLTLSWHCSDPDSQDTLTYDLYGKTIFSKFKKVSGNLSVPAYTVSGLKRYTTYYWKVVAKDNRGAETSSETWKFRTAR
ncbi:MAG: fibronectin type III domain-containing protein [Candidatus Omnitrophota bacterium]